jgi:hypothetical protein
VISRLRFSTIQKGLLLFWAIWLTLIALTNFFDALRQLGLLPEGWTFASYNYDLVRQTVGAHGVPAGIAAALFGGVIFWEALAAGLFWRAFAAVRRGRPGTSDEVSQAFTVGLALWAAFLIATEATVNYLTAPTHMSALIAQLASLLVIRSTDGSPQRPTPNA